MKRGDKVVCISDFVDAKAGFLARYMTWWPERGQTYTVRHVGMYRGPGTMKKNTKGVLLEEGVGGFSVDIGDTEATELPFNAKSFRQV